MKILFVYLTFLLLALSYETEHPKLVIELFRHGARGPLRAMGNNHWFGKEGELTNVGKNQHFVAGARLIQKYPHLKQTLLDPSKIFTQSSNFSRTIESLESHIWGMYKGINANLEDVNIYSHDFMNQYNKAGLGEIFNTDFKIVSEFNPTEVLINPLKGEMELFITEMNICHGGYDGKDPELKQKSEDLIRECINEINEQKNVKWDPVHFKQQMDVAFSNLFEGISLPLDIDPDSDLFKKMLIAAQHELATKRFGNKAQRDVFSIPLLTKIKKILEDGRLDNGYNLVLLSGHDVTILNFLTALNIINTNCLYEKFYGHEQSHECHFPSFASSVVIELWERVPDYFEVRMLYDWNVINYCGSKDGFCDFEYFRSKIAEATDSYTPIELYHVCRNRFMISRYDNNEL